MNMEKVTDCTTCAPFPTELNGAASQVSWQTAYWSILPLVLALMTQRAGSVCGTPSSMQVYMRTSPLVCLFDTLALTARLIEDVAYRKTTLREAARRAVRARTGGSVQVDNMRVVNWVAYALGVLPAYIKLVAFERMPWTTAWASPFVASYVVIEALFVLGAGEGPDKKAAKEKSGSGPSSANAKAEDEALQTKDRWSRISGLVALILHLAVLVWMSYSIYRRQTLISPWTYFPYSGYIAAAQWICVFMFMIPSDFPFPDDKYHWLGLGKDGITLFFPCFVSTFLVAGGFVFPFLWILLPAGLLGEAWCVLFIGSLVMSKATALSDQVFLVQEGYKVQACALWSLSMLTAGVTFWWYALCYQPEGTFKPEWTNIFG